MLEAELSSLFTPETLEAFRHMWRMSADDAEAEAREIIGILAEFVKDDDASPDEAAAQKAAKDQQKDQLLARLVLALVGSKPDLSAWLEAIAVGSFQLRPEQDYAHSGQLKSRARLLQRQQANLDKVEPLRRAWAEEADASQDAVHLIASSALLKELRANVAAKAALGPAWPLMVAVDKHFDASEMSQLHRFGADDRLIDTIACAVRRALRRYLRDAFPEGPPEIGRAADWRRTVPPGADVKGYFAGREQVGPAPTPQAIIEDILAGPKPSFLAEVEGKDWREIPLREHVRHLLPLGDATNETFRKAISALARERVREAWIREDAPMVASEDFRVQVWLRMWAEGGGAIPENIPIRYLGYLEEEACLAFETQGVEWPGVWAWRNYGVIGERPSGVKPATLHSYYEHVEVSWVSRRIVDRIDVSQAQTGD